MVNEFFGQEQGPAAREPFQFTDLQRELENVRHMRPEGNWQAEFNQGPRIWELKPEEEAAMEKAFQESRQAAGPNAAGKGKKIEN